MPAIPWRPSRRTTVAIGLLTLWPLLYAGLFLLVCFFMWASVARGNHTAPDLFLYIFPLHCGTMLITFALTGIYIYHACKTDRIASDQRVLWVVILFLGSMLAFPIYWYLFMWREPSLPA